MPVTVWGSTSHYTKVAIMCIFRPLKTGMILSLKAVDGPSRAAIIEVPKGTKPN